MPKLLIKSGPNAGQQYPVDGDIVVGRGSLTDVVIFDPTISRRHAMLAYADGKYIVSDLGSGNGTRLNGVRIYDPTELHDGDEIQFGSIRSEFAMEPGTVRRSADESSIRMMESEEPGQQEIIQRLDAGDAVNSLIAKSGDMDALLTMSKRLQLIYDVGSVISTTLDEERLFSLIMDKLFEVFPQMDRGFMMSYDSENNQLLPKVARTRSGETAEISVSRTLVRDAIETRQGILCADAMGDDRYSMGQSIVQFQIRTVVCVPMVAEDEVLGVINVDGDDPTKPFVKDDMSLLLGIAGQAALALANSRLHKRLLKQELIEQDLILANRIQHKFLPEEPPKIEGYDFQDEYSAALEVGGDYYDFLQLPSGRMGIALGDVSGKGVSAALYMAKLSSDVRFHSAAHEDPSEVLRLLNRSLAKDVEEGMFVTLVYLSLDPESGVLTYANAGHLQPVVRRADGEIVYLQGGANLPLGIEDDEEFVQDDFQLEPGDTVSIFTDGVVEATNAQEEQFEDARVDEAIKASDGTPADVKEKLLAAVEQFFDGAPQNDDLTLVCFGPQLTELELEMEPEVAVESEPEVAVESGPAQEEEFEAPPDLDAELAAELDAELGEELDAELGALLEEDPGPEFDLGPEPE